MKTTSLIGRTIAVVLAAELLCAIAFSVTALNHERWTRLRAFDVMLRGRSDTVLGAIQDSGDPDDHVSIDPTELKVPDEDVFAVYNLGGDRVGGSANDHSILTERQANGFFDRRMHGRSYRVYQRDAMRLVDRDEGAAQTLKRPITIVYAASTEYLWHEIREAAGFYAAVSCVILVLTGGLLVLLLRRVLEPIQELAERARAVSVLSPSFKAPESALRVRELQPLAETLTAAIAGLSEAFEKEHRFVGDAAHELKTAVAVVRSTIQVMMMKPRPQDEYVRGLDLLLTDNQRVEELVAQMLLLARMEEKTTRSEGKCDLSLAASKAMTKLQTYAEAHGVELAGDPGGSAYVSTYGSVSGTVYGPISPESADVLVSNLIVNAIQHSKEGSKVEVRTAMGDGLAILQVYDHGAGISAAALPHVFERFYREDVSRSRDTGGSGLGLAICKSIVDAAGGEIAIESEVDVGTTVTVTMKLA